MQNIHNSLLEPNLYGGGKQVPDKIVLSLSTVVLLQFEVGAYCLLFYLTRKFYRYDKGPGKEKTRIGSATLLLHEILGAKYNRKTTKL